jgi:hypothetical protein
MKPIPVGVEAALYVILGYDNVVVSADGDGLTPGLGFFLQKINVTLVIVVVTNSMAQLM